MVTFLKNLRLYIAVFWITSVFGNVVSALNDTTLPLIIRNDIVEARNQGMECWNHCHQQQGPCPVWCGKHGMCCTMNPFWNDKSNGCDGTFGGAWRNQCVYGEVKLCMNQIKLSKKP